jgi:hypothetical protein
MSEVHGEAEQKQAGTDGTPAEAVAGGSQWHPLTTAAVIGGALAATAGAYLGTRALARRNGGKDGKVNSVMATAITACDLAQRQSEPEPSAAGIIISPATKA